MRSALLLYDGFAPLDAFGPFHALMGLPDYEFIFVAERPGIVTAGPLRVDVEVGIDDVDSCDLLIVPGGMPDVTVDRKEDAVIDWIRKVHPTTKWTTSVCTGSYLLGAAGVLTGLRATSHWAFHEGLAKYGAIPTDERVVFAGKVVTAAGVSAGIDMSLHLIEKIAGTRWAQGTQLDMEYDPQPPFQSGHPRSAPADITEWVRGMYAGEDCPIVDK